MTTSSADHQPDMPAVHPRTRSMESWRARKAVMASRGETNGPRVAEARSALSWWRTRTFLIKEMDISAQRAESLLELVRQPETETAQTDAETAVTTR